MIICSLDPARLVVLILVRAKGRPWFDLQPTIKNIEHTVSQSLEAVHGEVANAIREEKIVNVDETGHKERNQNGWCWLTSTKKYTLFFSEEIKRKENS